MWHTIPSVPGVSSPGTGDRGWAAWAELFQEDPRGPLSPGPDKHCRVFLGVMATGGAQGLH